MSHNIFVLGSHTNIAGKVPLQHAPNVEHPPQQQHMHIVRLFQKRLFVDRQP
jgi:hypothetical protein